MPINIKVRIGYSERLNKQIYHQIPRERIMDGVAMILDSIGEDPKREGLVETPIRVADSFAYLFSGYEWTEKDVELLLTTFDAEKYEGMVVLHDIELYSMCEHHILPFLGRATVAYIPDKRIVGISKLARLVEVYARRLQTQERLTLQITEALVKHLEPLGVAVYIKAEHLCMRARGVEKQNSVMVTNEVRGFFREDGPARDEFMRIATGR